MKTHRASSLVATLMLTLTACGSSSKNNTSAGGDAGGNAVADGGTNSGFEACLASVQPNCVVSDMNTAEKMGTPCASVTLIPIPLTAGGNYGPMTIPGGPYGAKIMWNQGAGTEFVNPINSSESICPTIGVQSFREPASVNAEILNLRSIDQSIYTIFRPACMKDG